MNKLVNVLQATDLTERPAVSRELVLLRVRTHAGIAHRGPQGSRDLRRARGRFLRRRLRASKPPAIPKSSTNSSTSCAATARSKSPARAWSRVARSQEAQAAAAGAHQGSCRSLESNERSHRMAKRYYEKDGNLEQPEGQDRRHHRLRQPGPRARAESARFGRGRRSSASTPAARAGRRPKPPA